MASAAWSKLSNCIPELNPGTSLAVVMMTEAGVISAGGVSSVLALPALAVTEAGAGSAGTGSGAGAGSAGAGSGAGAGEVSSAAVRSPRALLAVARRVLSVVTEWNRSRVATRASGSALSSLRRACACSRTRVDSSSRASLVAAVRSARTSNGTSYILEVVLCAQHVRPGQDQSPVRLSASVAHVPDISHQAPRIMTLKRHGCDVGHKPAPGL